MNYTNDNRGRIQYRTRRRQIFDFSGLRFGNITPTDCDLLIEYHDKAYVLAEIKYRDAQVPRGQLLALERCADDFVKAQKHVLLIIAEHNQDNPDADIDAVNCTVREYYWHGKWHSHNMPLKDLVEKFFSYVDGR